MELGKWLNTVSVVFGFIGGVAIKLLGGESDILHVLFFMVIADFLTGVFGALVDGKINSKISYKGIFKTFLIFVIVALSVEIETRLHIAIKDITIMFYIANTGISLLENILPFLPVPEELKNTFEQIRNKKEEK